MRSFAVEFDDETRARLVGAMVLVCGSRSDAEDIAQEALAKAWSRWRKVSRARSPQAWVWRVAFNEAASRGRRRRAEQRAFARSGVEPEASTDMATVDRIAVFEAVASLPERQRYAIVCRYYSGLSVAETAEALGCAQGTVKALCSQAIERMRNLDLVDVPDITATQSEPSHVA